MTAVDVLKQTLKARQQVVTIYGTFTGDQINQMIEDAFHDVDDGSFEAGINTNATFDSNKAVIVIDYHDGRPVPSPDFEQEGRQSTPKPEPRPEPKPTIKPAPTPSQNEKKKGGLFGFLGRMFGNDEKMPEPKPQPTPKPTPKPQPIPKPQPKNEKPLQFADESIPNDVNYCHTVMDTGQGSFLDEININKAASFMIDTSDYNRTNAILQKEGPLYVGNSEGVCNLAVSGRSRHGMTTFFLDFELGMAKEAFYDHLSKGRKAAGTTMQRLTHGGNMHPLMKVYLAYAFFQKYVKYATEYVATMQGKPNGNFHMAYGPLMLKKGVCEGYSWALIHMLKTIGVPAMLVVGSKGGSNSHHAWVKAQINGQTYNLDPTVSSNGSMMFLIGFLKSDNFMKQHGYRESGSYPAANDTTYDDPSQAISLIQREKDDAIRKGGDRTILDLPVQGG